MHVHVSALTGLITFLYVLVFGFFWHFVAMKLADTPIGKAMAFLF